AEQTAQLLGGAGAEDLHALPQPLDELLGGLHADVGGEQGVLDLLPGVLVEVLAGQQGEQALAEGVLRAGQTGPQADQAALGGGRDLDGGSLRGGRLLDDDGGAVRKINLLDGAPRFLPRRLGLVADVRLGRRGGDVGRGRRRPTMPPPIAPSTTTAMTTARMTVSITRPVSAMAPPAAPTAGRPDRPCRGLAHPGHLTARQLPSVPEPPGGRWTRRREPSH